MDAVPRGWQVVDGALTRVAGGGDIITREPFRNFVLELDWNIAPGGNSGGLPGTPERKSNPDIATRTASLAS